MLCTAVRLQVHRPCLTLAFFKEWTFMSVVYVVFMSLILFLWGKLVVSIWTFRSACIFYILLCCKLMVYVNYVNLDYLPTFIQKNEPLLGLKVRGSFLVTRHSQEVRLNNAKNFAACRYLLSYYGTSTSTGYPHYLTFRCVLERLVINSGSMQRLGFRFLDFYMQGNLCCI